MQINNQTNNSETPLLSKFLRTEMNSIRTLECNAWMQKGFNWQLI